MSTTHTGPAPDMRHYRLSLGGQTGAGTAGAPA